MSKITIKSPNLFNQTLRDSQLYGQKMYIYKADKNKKIIIIF